MESFIHDLDEEAAKTVKEHSHDDHSTTTTTTTTTIKSTLSGDTTYDKAQIGMNGPGWTGAISHGENAYRAGGPDHHLDELESNDRHQN